MPPSSKELDPAPNAGRGCPHVGTTAMAFVYGYKTAVRYALCLKARSLRYIRKTFKISTLMNDDSEEDIETDSGKRKRAELTVDDHIKKLSEIPAFRCNACKTTKSKKRPHVCLSCVYTGCRESHMPAHLADNHHPFAMDLQSCDVWCGYCKQYAYDRELRRIYKAEARRMMLIIAHALEPKIKRKRRVAPPTPNAGDLTLIEGHSEPQLCSGLRGLVNAGSTCYLNAILQALLHNAAMKSYFLTGQHTRKNCSKQYTDCLVCQVDRLFQAVYSSDPTPMCPSDLLQAFWRNTPSMAGNEQQDAHEFLLALRHELHKAFQNSALDANGRCVCPVCQVFGGEEQSSIKCTACGHVSVTKTPMEDLCLSVTTALDSPGEGSSPRRGKKRKTPLSLPELLDRHTKPEEIDYRCEKCHSKDGAKRQASISELPPVFCVAFKRMETRTRSGRIETQKVECAITVPMELDMTPYTSTGIDVKNSSDSDSDAGTTSSEESEPRVPGWMSVKHHNPAHQYSLISTVIHKGSNASGHYWAHAKESGNWYKFDDVNVSELQEKDIQAGNIYVAFYIRNGIEHEYIPPPARPAGGGGIGVPTPAAAPEQKRSKRSRDDDEPPAVKRAKLAPAKPADPPRPKLLKRPRDDDGAAAAKRARLIP
ncbi:uncharacterized protein EV422DRAFT_569274 [Fimicolochytrium jonesii]|uniref:uncharacterized protein n=1 Tax=Fimicolochytrium jonesii TaxID=1396493 RepID=UPI0022FDBA6D|nr:uncharacterized protein EV422DRAFT_569274 [Fimicolochytrium jonesii]KAI8818995.1 hypothetical protein EV422DRAFT_569274 [Fimicolochytrium jonesii]